MESASATCGCTKLQDYGPPGLTISTVVVSSMFSRLRLWSDSGPATRPPRPSPPLPEITYDKGLPSLPDDVIYEIFNLLDTEALKSCSLAGKAVSPSAKPFLHRTLHLTPREQPGVPKEPNTPGNWNEFKGLPALGERGLLQHTRHISIFLGRNPLFPHDLQPHTQHLRTLTNLRSLKTRWLDIPSFIPKMGEYFGAFLWSLRSLELEYPRGDHEQILYFICQFPNLQDLRIKGTQDHIHSIRNGGPHFTIKSSPPLNGTLDLELNMSGDKAALLVLTNLVTVPSGLKFRTLKLSGCAGSSSQLLLDTCAISLECVHYTWMGGSFPCKREISGSSNLMPGNNDYPQLSFKLHPGLRKLEIKIFEWANTGIAAAWLFGTLSTITSNVFTELTISIARVSFSFSNTSENQVREWNSVDNVLDRLSLCEDVTLVVKPQLWAIDDEFKGLIEKYFPLMWENERVVLEGPPPHVEDGPIRRTRVGHLRIVGQ